MKSPFLETVRPKSTVDVIIVENPTRVSKPPTDGKFLSQNVVVIGKAGMSYNNKKAKESKLYTYHF